MFRLNQATEDALVAIVYKRPIRDRWPNLCVDALVRAEMLDPNGRVTERGYAYVMEIVDEAHARTA